MVRIIILIAFLCTSTNVFADHLISVEKALKKIYRKATQFKEHYINLTEDQVDQIATQARINFAGSHSPRLIKYSAFANDQLIGVAYEDTVIGKWGPIHYLVGLDLEGNIIEVKILDYLEIRGKPIAKRRFLKQYRKKSINSPLRLRKDIDGVTGATISSRSLTDGVRKILIIHSITN